MIKIMARENMEEWGTNSAILQETVRATVDAFAKGQIKLPEVELQSKVPNQIKTAPSFISFSISVRSGERRGDNSNKNPLYYTNHTLAEFLGWVTDNGKPQDRVTDAVAALASLELSAGQLSPRRSWISPCWERPQRDG